MATKWNPLEKEPANVSTDAKIRWHFDHMAAFQREHPELPQGDWMNLKRREQKLVLVEYDLAVARAGHGGAVPPEIEKAIRTGALVVRGSTTTRK